MNAIAKFLLVVFVLCQGTAGAQNWFEFSPYFPLQSNGRMGIMDEKGNTILEPVYFKIKGIPFSSGKKYFALQDERGWTLLGLTGNMVILSGYQEIKTFGRSSWLVLNENAHQFRLYSMQKDSLYPTVFRFASGYDFPALQVSPQNWQVFLEEGPPIEIAGVDSVCAVSQHLCGVRRGKEENLHFYDTGKEMPYRDYYSATPMNNGWKLMTAQGEYYVPRGDGPVLGPFFKVTEYSWGLVVEQDWKTKGVMTYAGDTVIPLEMENVNQWGNWIIAEGGTKFSLYDTLIKHVKDFPCDTRELANEPRITLLSNSDTTYVVKQDGSVPLKLPAVRYMDSNRNLIAIKGKSGWGVLNMEGELLAPLIYTKGRLLGEKSAEVLTDSGTKILHFDPETKNARKVLVVRADSDAKSGDDFSNWQAWGVSNVGWRVPPVWGRNDSLARSRGWFYSSQRRRWGFVSPETGDTLLAPLIHALFPIPNRSYTIMGRLNSRGYMQYGVFNDEKGRIEIEPTATNFDWQILDKLGKSRFVGPNDQWMLYEFGHRPYHMKGTTYIPPSITGEYLVIRGGQKSNRAASREFENRFSEPVGEDMAYYVGGKMRMARWKNLADNKFDYDRLQEFRDGRVLYCKGGEWGVIDTLNRVITGGYKKLIELNGQLIGVKDVSNIGLINFEGETITPSPVEALRGYSEGLAAAKQNGLWGMMDLRGNWVVPPTYDWAHTFKQNRICVGLKDSVLVLDENGQFVFGLKGTVTSPFSDGWLLAKEGRGSNFYNVDGEKMTQEKFLVAKPFANGQAIVGTIEGKFLINSAGERIPTPKIESILPANGCGYQVSSGKEIGWLQPDGTFWPLGSSARIISATENAVLFWNKGGYKLANAENPKGKKIKASKVHPFSEGLAMAEVNGMIGYMNDQGVWAVEPQYNAGESFKNGHAIVRTPSGYVVIDRTGAILPIPPMERRPQQCEGKWLVRRNDEWESWTADGQKTVLKTKALSLKVLPDGKFLEEGKQGFAILDEEGNGVRVIKVTGEFHLTHYGIMSVSPETKYLIAAGKNQPLPIWEGSLEVRGNLTHMLINGESAYLDASGSWVRKPNMIGFD